MKCPKCDYLGFETGDRCKNCGYDFSLLSIDAPPAEPDLPLNQPADLDVLLTRRPHRDPLDKYRDTPPPPVPEMRPVEVVRPVEVEMTPVEVALEPVEVTEPILDAPSTSAVAWLDHLDKRDTPEPAVTEAVPEMVPDAVSEVVPEEVSEVEQERPRPRLVEPSLPLFNPAGLDDDAPLIKLPAAPRPPLAVRRTPETPRLRAVPKPSRRGAEAAARAEAEPVLAFEEEASRRVDPPRTHVRPLTAASAPSTPGRRATAAAVDHAILLGIDVTVIYFTLRLAEMSAADWRLLPIAPVAIFLGLLKVSYFSVFTLIGGQTIGKMAARIQVVSDDDAPIDPARAIRRTIAGVASVVTLGLGYLPALIAADRRALHDRVARTRVVSLS